MSCSLHPSFKNGAVLTAGEVTFYDAAYLAEQTWQAATKTTPAQALAADIAKHRSIVQAAATAGLGHLGGPSRSALRSLTGAEV